MVTRSKQRLSVEDLQRLAGEYYDIAMQIKALEKDAKIYKDALVAEGEARGLTEPLDLGQVVLEPRVRTKVNVNDAAITPDWLYRFQSQGGRVAVKLDEKTLDKVDEKTLAEVDYKREESLSIAIVLQPN